VSKKTFIIFYAPNGLYYKDESVSRQIKSKYPVNSRVFYIKCKDTLSEANPQTQASKKRLAQVLNPLFEKSSEIPFLQKS